MMWWHIAAVRQRPTSAIVPGTTSLDDAACVASGSSALPKVEELVMVFDGPAERRPRISPRR